MTEAALAEESGPLAKGREQDLLVDPDAAPTGNDTWPRARRPLMVLAVVHARNR